MKFYKYYIVVIKKSLNPFREKSAFISILKYGLAILQIKIYLTAYMVSTFHMSKKLRVFARFL